MDVNQLANEIQKSNTTALAKAITLVESRKLSDWEKAKQLLAAVDSSNTESFRIGFSGPPGAGKSSFIEKLGLALVDDGYKVAVLAVDPSSELSGGSILGDKTRMENLSRKAFVRPSPTRGHLGGVTSSLPASIQLCEAAGFEWILIESVGVGQSEIELSRMVDLFTLISQPGAGDELQGIKKGILEYVDLILVNKVDRDPQLVNMARQQLLAALKILRGRDVSVLACSALKGTGVGEALAEMKSLLKKYKQEKRQSFNQNWFESLAFSEFKNRILVKDNLKLKFDQQLNQVKDGNLSPLEAVDAFYKNLGF